MSKTDTIWFTRCPVPTATGLAYKLGWLDQEFATEGIALKTLQEVGGELARQHYDHELTTLIREGGNLFALPARAQGANTRLIGLTWIDEWQSILVRPGSQISSPADLAGKRLALPRFRDIDLAENKRGRSIARGMSLAGYHGALASAGLTLEDVTLVEVGSTTPQTQGDAPGAGLWHGIEALILGEVDAVYVKGAAAADAARAAGAVVGINLDQLPQRRHRVNNGTPRPITVHQDFLDQHFDLVVRFLAQTLRAADWARSHEAEVRAILQAETRAGSEGVAAAYRDGFHLSLAPDLSDERLSLFELQKNFQLRHGFLDRDVDVRAWADHAPLKAAHALLQQQAKEELTHAS
ncbi:MULTISPECIES: ABC transporter substrate-binding protein [unclassified Duganella]|uniref:ABC transporter substrate-binding protein n=1 Tax=unclassified Duganella TaxID=2636909 RepID=UPI00087E29A7|nr:MULTISPECIES: ABC transporter substrate-binding protein [unclassified Duganella]SDF43148.1 NMT1/THI5 like [Duganella sp. OV458]SDI83430.1 2'-hydroxybiphenyl-2-sulfinate desulfinase [Duganella sp. OV510]